MDLLTALGVLCAAVQAAEGVPQGLKDFAALIARAQATRRALEPAEIAALKTDDDQMRAALDAAIANRS